MKKGEKEGKEKFAISLKYNKMQRNEKCPLPSVNQRVAGSSPARGAKTYRNVSLFFVFNAKCWVRCFIMIVSNKKPHPMNDGVFS